MSLREQRLALARWFEQATHLKTIWAGFGKPKLAYPYATLRVLSDSVEGGDKRRRFRPDLPPGQQLETQLREDLTLTLSCQVLARPDPRMGEPHCARPYLEAARRSLKYATVRAELRQVNLAVAGVAMPIRDLFDSVDNCPVHRSMMDVAFNFARTLVPERERTSIIERIEGELEFEQERRPLQVIEE